jgi:hypothetical protein
LIDIVRLFNQGESSRTGPPSLHNEDIRQTASPVAITLLALLLLSSAQLVHSTLPPRTFLNRSLGLIPDKARPTALAYDSQDGRLYVLNEAGNISVISPVLKSLPNGSEVLTGYSVLNKNLIVGQGSDTIVYALNVNTLYITNHKTNSVIGVSGSVSYTNGTVVTPPKIIANISVPFFPLWDCLSGNSLYVVSDHGNISVIDTAKNRIVANIPYSTFFNGLACGTLSGEIYLTTFSGQVLAVNATTSKANTIFSGPTPSCCYYPVFDPANGALYVEQGQSVLVIDTRAPAVVANVSLNSLSGIPGTMLLDPINNLVFVSTMLDQTAVIDSYSNTVISGIPLSGVPNPYPVAYALDLAHKVLYTDFLQGAIQVNSFSLGAGNQTATTTQTVTTTQATTSSVVFKTTRTASTVTLIESSTVTSYTTVTSSSITSQENQTALALLAVVGLVTAVETVYIIYGRRRHSP